MTPRPGIYSDGRGEVFGDDVVAAAMIDRLVHHAEVIALKAAPTASKTGTPAAYPPSRPTTNETKLVNFRSPAADQFSVAVDISVPQLRTGVLGVLTLQVFQGPFGDHTLRAVLNDLHKRERRVRCIDG